MKSKLIFFFLLGWTFNIQAQTEVSFPSEIIHINQTYHITGATSLDSASNLITKVLQALPTGNAFNDQSERLALNITLANLFFKKKSYDQALRTLNVSRNIYNNLYPGSAHYWISEYLGICYFHRGNYLLAGQHLGDALGTKEVKSDRNLENEIRDYIIRIYNLLPTYSLSDDFFLQSIEIKSKLGDTKGMKQVAQKLTEMLYTQHRYEKSLQYAKMTLELTQKLHLKDESVQAEIDIVNNLIRLNRMTESKNLLHSLKNKINASDFHLISRYETACGDFELLMGNEALGEKHYLAAFPPRAGPTLAQYVYFHQAETFKQTGNYKKAYEAQDKYVKELNESYVSSVLPAVVQLEEKSARSKLNEEVRYLELQNQLKDSLFYNQKLLADVLSKSNELQKSELKNQAQLSQSMQHEVELQKQKVKNEQRLRMLFIASSMAFFIMGAIIFNLYRKQKSKNKIISQQSSEKETLMKEIHHRVKNNLQIISSLLDMQSLSIKDPVAAEAIKEGKNRVLSMALIHQNLYHDGHIRSIRIDDYIVHLSKSLFDSYRIDDTKIKLVTDIVSLNLDVDTVVPLGLIINELITNSLKYAFKKQDHGTIQIILKKINEDQLHFKLYDDGIGFPTGWTPESTDSFGYQLIKAFSKKIKAKLQTYNDPGAVVDLKISKYKLG
ncbi:MAG: sensor histidine kinase [Saprospiraceae bacterium]